MEPFVKYRSQFPSAAARRLFLRPHVSAVNVIIGKTMNADERLSETMAVTDRLLQATSVVTGIFYREPWFGRKAWKQSLRAAIIAQENAIRDASQWHEFCAADDDGLLSVQVKRLLLNSLKFSESIRVHARGRL